MNQIRVHSVVTHTVHCLRPAPAKADAAIRNFADFIVFYINIFHICLLYTSPPTIYVKGKTVNSDSSWRVTYEDKEWIDESGKASDTSASI